jgi:hypothetical protein
MPNVPVTARIVWTFSHDRGASVAELKGRDSVTQQEHRIELPLHAIPALGDLIAAVVGAHPDLFPETLESRFT